MVPKKIKHTFFDKVLFHCNKFIFTVSNSDFFSMRNSCFPTGFRENAMEVVVIVASSFFFTAISQHTVRKNRLSIYGFCTGHIKSYGIERSKHSYIWNDGSVIFSMAVTIWRYIDHQTDMEMRAIVNNCLCVFCNFAV